MRPANAACLVVLVLACMLPAVASAQEVASEPAPPPLLVAGSGPVLTVLGVAAGALLNDVNENAGSILAVASVVFLPSVGNWWMGNWKGALLWTGARLVFGAAGVIGLAVIVAAAFGGSSDLASGGLILLGIGVVGTGVAIGGDAVQAYRLAVRRREAAWTPWIVPTRDGLRAGVAWRF